MGVPRRFINCSTVFGALWITLSTPVVLIMDREMDWQPIETAPRHYKPILACNPEKGHEAIVVHNGAEWELLSHDGFPMGIGFYPTHWMPLPKPPLKETTNA